MPPEKPETGKKFALEKWRIRVTVRLYRNMRVETVSNDVIFILLYLDNVGKAGFLKITHVSCFHCSRVDGSHKKFSV